MYTLKIILVLHAFATDGRIIIMLYTLVISNYQLAIFNFTDAASN